ncbi:autotransporter outer membrane beta-barrel domain-containing protein [uncultured Thiohalocapsa sp.]|uniref:autotransporter family protein n=1 Tax=uncultured Thiohalocapsa sp. TaxID=768990 RepID=UPI0025DB98D4|nr:autotransporter outer membrane beta-barrel domain-containing protein [uncultured Thiohalocapsa sp.]
MPNPNRLRTAITRAIAERRARRGRAVAKVVTLGALSLMEPVMVAARDVPDWCGGLNCALSDAPNTPIDFEAKLDAKDLLFLNRGKTAASATVKVSADHDEGATFHYQSQSDLDDIGSDSENAPIKLEVEGNVAFDADLDSGTWNAPAGQDSVFVYYNHDDKGDYPTAPSIALGGAKLTGPWGDLDRSGLHIRLNSDKFSGPPAQASIDIDAGAYITGDASFSGAKKGEKDAALKVLMNEDNDHVFTDDDKEGIGALVTVDGDATLQGPAGVIVQNFGGEQGVSFSQSATNKSSSHGIFGLAEIYGRPTVYVGNISGVRDKDHPNETKAKAGSVTAELSGRIVNLKSSSPRESPGVVIQSIGGMGTEAPKDGYYHVGDDAQGGGGDVTVTAGSPGTYSTIETKGPNSFGVLVQSIGGGGGFLPYAGDAAKVIGTSGETNASAGGTVTVKDFHNSITTGADGSPGMIVHSIGGGGGKAAGNVPDGTQDAFAGGSGDHSGDAGGAGGTVSVDLSNSITTTGIDSAGLHVQSIGGGGGAGHNAAGVGYAVGGAGGGGGDGGNITVKLESDAKVTTGNDYAYGAVAQSVGGGGGHGGSAHAFGVGLVGVAVAQGGRGGEGGHGGSITATNEGSIVTGAPGTATQDNPQYGKYGGKHGVPGQHAVGLLGQSVGGGGGSGGAANAFSAGLVAISVATGGNAGKGGHGGDVTLTNNGSLVTHGPDAFGMLGHSVGGGGGHGGAATARAIALAVPDPFDPKVSFGLHVDVAVGGSGGDGGDGGTVSLSQGGTLTTHGTGAHGMVGHSVGGGGGHGGDSTAAGIMAAIPGSEVIGGQLNLSIGGKGGTGGKGETVTLANHGTLTTTGDHAAGILGQSIGGGGGVGGVGDASNEGYFVTGKLNATFSMAIGGGGGNAHDGGRVSVINTRNGEASLTSISTSGRAAEALHAQSIGGGGGRGGGGAVDSGSGFVNLGFGIGGYGSGGGDGGPVLVNNNGSLSTAANGADAIRAQSIGGGGGAGGSAGSTVDGAPLPGGAGGTGLTEVEKKFNIGIAVGGRGAGGGDGGDVTVNNELDLWGDGGSISTQGHAADGIFAQSVGGGGGVGGTGSIGTENEPKALSFSLDLGFGGKGGGGGHGGTVSVTNTGSIETHGHHAVAVHAQSIGGGGGKGGTAGAENPLDDPNEMFSGLGAWKWSKGWTFGLEITEGGAGGNGGNGGDVSLSNSGSLTTHGDHAPAVLLHSIGGGGGRGYTTNKVAADTDNIPIYIGARQVGEGTNGQEGSAGKVTVTGGGKISTAGHNAVGVMAHNAAAGGALLLLDGDQADRFPAYLAGVSPSVNGVRLNTESDEVRVDLSKGSITTTGDGASAVLAQSVGGSGGIVGDLSRVHPEADAGDIDVVENPYTYRLPSDIKATMNWPTMWSAGSSVAAPGGPHRGILVPTGWASADAASGTSGPVRVYLEGYKIQTQGTAAHGILAQTVGGSGGLFASGPNGGLGYLNADSGGFARAPDIRLTDTTITTSGQNAAGVFAMALGDKKAFDGVYMDHHLINSSITTSGEQAVGYAMMSSIMDGSLSLTKGASIKTINGLAAGVRFDGRGGNPSWTLSLDATSSISATGADSYAVEKLGGGTATVNNNGKITGSLKGVTTFNNHGTHVTGAELDAGTMLHAAPNAAADARLEIHGVGRYGTTDLKGTDIHFAGNPADADGGRAVVHMDLDYATGEHDRVVNPGRITGADGAAVLVMNARNMLPQHKDKTFTLWEGGAAADYARIFSTPEDFGAVYNALDYGSLRVSLAADFGFERRGGLAAQDLTATQHALGQHLQHVWDHGHDAEYARLEPVFTDLATLETAADYARTLANIDSAALPAVLPVNLEANREFTDRLMDCPDAASACLWGHAGGGRRWYDHGERWETLSASFEDVQAGGFRRLGEHWSLGAALGYTNSRLDSGNDRERVDADTLNLGLAARYRAGALSIGAGLSWSHHWNDASRTVLPASGPRRASADFDTSVTTLRTDLRYRLGVGDGWQLAPALAVSASRLALDDFQESGAGAYDLAVAGDDQWIATVAPSLTLRRDLTLDNGTMVKPWLRLGAAGRSDDSAPVDLRLAGAGGGHATEVSQPVPDWLVTADAGLTIHQEERWAIDAQIQTASSDDYQDISGQLQLRMRF